MVGWMLDLLGRSERFISEGEKTVWSFAPRIKSVDCNTVRKVHLTSYV
jgi:hypothetical protein